MNIFLNLFFILLKNSLKKFRREGFLQFLILLGFIEILLKVSKFGPKFVIFQTCRLDKIFFNKKIKKSLSTELLNHLINNHGDFEGNALNTF